MPYRSSSTKNPTQHSERLANTESLVVGSPFELVLENTAWIIRNHSSSQNEPASTRADALEVIRERPDLVLRATVEGKSHGVMVLGETPYHVVMEKLLASGSESEESPTPLRMALSLLPITPKHDDFPLQIIGEVAVDGIGRLLQRTPHEIPLCLQGGELLSQLAPLPYRRRLAEWLVQQVTPRLYTWLILRDGSQRLALLEKLATVPQRGLSVIRIYDATEAYLMLLHLGLLDGGGGPAPTFPFTLGPTLSHMVHSMSRDGAQFSPYTLFDEVFGVVGNTAYAAGVRLVSLVEHEAPSEVRGPRYPLTRVLQRTVNSLIQRLPNGSEIFLRAERYVQSGASAFLGIHVEVHLDETRLSEQRDCSNLANDEVGVPVQPPVAGGDVWATAPVSFLNTALREIEFYGGFGNVTAGQKCAKLLMYLPVTVLENTSYEKLLGVEHSRLGTVVFITDELRAGDKLNYELQSWGYQVVQLDWDEVHDEPDVIGALVGPRTTVVIKLGKANLSKALDQFLPQIQGTTRPVILLGGQIVPVFSNVDLQLLHPFTPMEMLYSVLERGCSRQKAPLRRRECSSSTNEPNAGWEVFGSWGEAEEGQATIELSGKALFSFHEAHANSGPEMWGGVSVCSPTLPSERVLSLLLALRLPWRIAD